MAVGSEMAGFTVVGVVLDFALDTLPWFTVALTILGFVVAFYHLIRMSRAMAQSARRRPDGNEP
jgi:F0F1-type ATP synthase assembly protein I